MRGVAGVILNGGRSSRMGGGDKTLLEIDGQSLLSRSIDRLQPQVDRVALNANGNPERFTACNLPVIGDIVPGHAGPLAGILTAMIWARQERFDQVVTVAGDSPFFPLDLVARLSDAAPTSSAPIAVATSLGRRHPVFALWPVVLANELSAHLASPGSGRVNDFLELSGVAEVAFEASDDAPDPFFNVNTPNDLEHARKFATKADP